MPGIDFNRTAKRGSQKRMPDNVGKNRKVASGGKLKREGNWLCLSREGGLNGIRNARGIHEKPLYPTGVSISKSKSVLGISEPADSDFNAVRRFFCFSRKISGVQRTFRTKRWNQTPFCDVLPFPCCSNDFLPRFDKISKFFIMKYNNLYAENDKISTF